VPITYSQAVLGDNVTVPTIDGKVEYTVPEGTQSGTTFRLRGKGIQYLNGRGRGDMYVKCEVEIPKKLNKTQREALKKFESTLKDENYEQRKGFFKKLKDMFNS
jgi:molecular chaperone DnaJ